MSVKIGEARGGDPTYTPGDQTLNEVRVTAAWYSCPWNFVLRPKSAAVAEKMAQTCEAVCANNNIGYSQTRRNDLLTAAKKVNFDISKIQKPADCDCSSLMSFCAVAAGVLSYTGNAPYTGNMREKFTATGAFDVLTDAKYLTSDKYLKRGDVLVNTVKHTAMVLSNGANVSSTQSNISHACNVVSHACNGTISVGDIVQFKGGKHYGSANAATGNNANAGPAKVTMVLPDAKHPYHVQHTDRTSIVYGWVDAADVTVTGKATSNTHTVVPGDTLWGIAQKYGTTIAALCEANGISASALILPGQVLKV